MASPVILRVWQASWIFDFFFQKIQHEVLYLEILSILSIFWVWHIKIVPKLKNCKKV